MTDNELKKLSRAGLLEILVAQSKEIERLEKELETEKEKVQSRQIEIDKAGTLAEASLQLNEVFKRADEAAKQYLENIKLLSGRQEEICAQMAAETKEKCEQMERETLKRCRMLSESAKEECDKMIASAKKEVLEPEYVPQSNFDKAKSQIDKIVQSFNEAKKESEPNER